MPLHADDKHKSNEIRQAINLMDNLNVLTDANITAANTVDGLVSAVETAVDAATNHAEIAPMKPGFVRALRQAEALGIISDAILADMETVAALKALFEGSNASNASTFLP